MRRVMATLLLAAAVPAQADMAAPERQKLHAYLSGSDYIDALAKIGIYWDRSVLGRHTDCQSRYEVAPMAFGVLDPVQFDPESSQPRQGIWRQRFGLTRCGEQAIYNVLAIVRDGKLQLQPQVPGDSRVAPVLLSQLLREGVAARSAQLEARMGACPRTAVADTRVTLAPADRVLAGQRAQNLWEEHWTIKRCDSRFEMSFCFKQSPQGGIDWAPRACSEL